MIIKKQKSSPKYVQLKNELIRSFEKNGYQTGQIIPTEVEIKDAYQVGRNTVRKALEELVKEGLITKKHGSGSYYTGKQSAKSKSSSLIGVILPKLTFYIYPQIIRGISHVVEKEGYNIVLGGSEVSLEKEMENLQQLLDKNIEGLIIEPTGGSRNFEDSENFKNLKALNIPVVFLDWMIDDKDVSFISPNDFIGGYRATQHLIDAGHSRIAFIGPFDKGAGVKRMNGYQKALKKAGIQSEEALIKLTSIYNWNEEDTIPDMIHELLELGEKRPTAIFFYNDDGAIKGCKTIKSTGLEIPGDISVVGYDDSELATLTDLQLTSIIHPKYKLGVWAAELLLEQLEKPKNKLINQLVVNPGIADRDSVKKLNS